MTAAPKRKRTDPLSTVLFDLENLKEDIAYLVDAVPSFKSLDQMASLFIKAIHQARAEQLFLKERP